MKKAYFYPIWAYMDKVIPNPYMDNFMDSLAGDFHFLNRGTPSVKGILSIIPYYRQTEYIFLNWIEDLPDKKGGAIQTVFFVFLVFLARLQGKKLVWTMHNKLSHYKSNRRAKAFLFRFIMRRSHFILTHSKEGINYAKEFGVSGIEEKIRYYPHPLENRIKEAGSPARSGFLIWGSIIPYKGIHDFLKHLHERGLEDSFRIRIAGEVRPPEYEKEISRYCNKNIVLENGYIEEEELKEMISGSSSVIFTYIGNSVLSSGVLMDSLSFGAKVLGPRVGAFMDMEEEGLAGTYHGYDELIDRMEALKDGEDTERMKKLEAFIERSNWKAFGAGFSSWILNKK